eukprot:gnl/MRDRNA2_/MRDRNA2_32203_c0_seq1.p1 gnl/MRDRNA2_/MRDRNA2_32203_c0~~gnl/MRDRNA2_/MRDRNA2_32203_c0_seq1.p1  ORF type:complete len:637 (+),score=110.75 gnl/MRDRNA2_/MRDRNA2_32203_c0_seq1:141-2051(+)
MSEAQQEPEEYEPEDYDGSTTASSCAAGCASSGVAKEKTLQQPTAKAAAVAVHAISVIKQSKESKQSQVLFNASHCMYDCIFEAVKRRGWRVIKTEAKGSTCNVHWLDESGISEWFPKIEPWMKVNHFPGTHNALARKSRLARNMARVQRLFPVEYSFLPDTWVLPDEIEDLEKQYDKSGNSKTIYIAKPDAGTQGRGIFLTNSLDKLKKCADRDNIFVVQRYISKPMLIDGMKFDLRLYFLHSCILTKEGTLIPRYFLFRDGLVRLCTAEYEAPTADNIDKRRMHLTNYAINKKSKDFQQNDGDDDGAGSKRSLKWFMEYIAECHGEAERSKLWNKLRGLCVKMSLAVHPNMDAEYANVLPKDHSGGAMGCRCFEVLGVDVMLDSKRRPYLIEVNHLPSFTCDSPLDEDIKSRVVEQTLDLTCQCDMTDKQTYEAAVAAKKNGSPAVNDNNASLLETPFYKDFERVYPAPVDTPKAAARYEAILTRVTEVFRPVATLRRPSPSERAISPGPSDSAAAEKSSRSGYVAERAAQPSASSSSSGFGLPPKLPPTTSKSKPPASAASGDSGYAAAVSRIFQRARSVPSNLRRSQDLQTPASTPGSARNMRRPASREGSLQPRQRQPRQCLPMVTVQIGL